MAKVILDPVKSQMRVLCGYIRGEMFAQDIGLAEMGEELGITPQGMSYKFKNLSFTAEELLRIFKKLKTDGSTIARLMA